MLDITLFGDGQKLNIAAFYPVARSAGPGVRAAIWLQGCLKRCPGCVTPQMLKIADRTWVSVKDLAKMLLALDEIEGVTLYGGEPMLQYRALASLFEIIRKARLSTLVYTGYLYEELLQYKNPDMQNLLCQIDILVDGPYIRALDHGEKWRGSANQRILFLTDRYQDYHWVEEARDRDLYLHYDTQGNYVILGIPPRDFDFNKIYNT